MAKRKRKIRKAPKVGTISRSQAKAAAKAVSVKAIRSENASRKKAIKAAMAEFKKSVNAAMKQFLAALA